MLLFTPQALHFPMRLCDPTPLASLFVCCQLPESPHPANTDRSCVLPPQTTAVVRIPFEIVKQQLQAKLHDGAAACIRHIWATKGVSGFFTGYSSLVLREVSRCSVSRSHLCCCPSLCHAAAGCDEST